MKQLNKILILLFLLFLPTQLGKHFFFDFSYLSGIRIDYLTPTIYITDILALLLVVMNWKTVLSFLKEKKTIFILGLLLFPVAFSKLPLISLYRYIKILELFFLYAVFRKKPLQTKPISIGFLLAAIFEFVLAIWQFGAKHSLQGLFYLFGERNLNLSIPGIAKASLNGIELLRPYGTFSHPNSLGGFYLLIYVYILTQKNIKPLFRHLILLLSSLLVFISFSKIAIGALVLCTIIFIFKQKINCTLCKISRILTLVIPASIFLFVQTDPLTIEKRGVLLKNAFEIIRGNPLFGVGLGTYVVAQQDLPTRYLDMLQPVHNIFLLMVSELGIVIFVILAYLFLPAIRSFIKRFPYLALAIVVTGFFDHYWLTLQQNFLLLAFLFAETSVLAKQQMR